MLAFGAASVSLGLYLWHGLGSLKDFVNDPYIITRPMAYVVFGALVVAVAVGVVLSPR